MKPHLSEEMRPDVAGQSDGRLIVRLCAGDVDALGELYEKYKGSIFRTALAITRDRSAAEDILQECFLRLFNCAERIRTDVSLEPWLYRVAVNLSYSWVQRRQRSLAVLDEVLEGLTASLHRLPERWLERMEAQEAVRRGIEKLPLNHRVVVVLFYLEGLSLREIAEVLEIPEGTVKSRLHHARQSLKELLAERQTVPGVAYEFT